MVQLRPSDLRFLCLLGQAHHPVLAFFEDAKCVFILFHSKPSFLSQRILTSCLLVDDSSLVKTSVVRIFLPVILCWRRMIQRILMSRWELYGIEEKTGVLCLKLCSGFIATYASRPVCSINSSGKKPGQNRKKQELHVSKLQERDSQLDCVPQTTDMIVCLRWPELGQGIT